MLASRVARASAKGRSQQSEALKLSSVYTNLARKFFGPVPPRRPCLIQSRPALSGKNAPWWSGARAANL